MSVSRGKRGRAAAAALVGGFAILLTACAEDDVATVSGTATYRERIALSPEAEFRVALLDVSRQDVAAETLAAETISDPGPVPIAFELEYDPDRIDERMSYVVRATIYEQGQMRFTTTQAVPVLTRGSPDTVSLVLEGVGDRRAASGTAPDWRAKVEFDLDALNENGLRGPPDGLRAVSYEFCVPDDEATIAEVRAIDGSFEFQRGSPGRVDCREGRVLVIGETSRAGWRQVLERVASRDDVARIAEYFGE